MSRLDSVVKVQAMLNPPDYDQPWQTKGTSPATGSGCIIRTPRGPRVLTSAHCVEHHTFVEVRRNGKTRKHVAVVEAMGHDCDLAILRVDDDRLFEGLEFIELGSMPHLSDHVSVCGFPVGGEHLSITEGVVSRIELTSYVQSQRLLLAVQIDAAINSGNSGGPVFCEDRLIGVAFQAYDDGQNIGYMIAPPVIEHFLDDVASGSAAGFPSLGIHTQELQSKSHRRSLGLADDDRGVLVTRVAHGSSAWGALQVGDVLLGIDDTSISYDGTVPFAEGQLIDFVYLVSQHHVGDRIRLDVWRDGEPVAVEVELHRHSPLVREVPRDGTPSYYVFGGLLLVPLTRDYLRSWGDDWWTAAPHRLVALYEEEMRTPERHEIVVLQRVLPDAINQGYHAFENEIVTRIDGHQARSLADLIELVETGVGDFVRFEFTSGAVIVLDRKAALDAASTIKARFGFKADRSPDLG
jgi:S1-C subfamily serine protease